MKLIPITSQIQSAEADLVMYRKALPEMVKAGRVTQEYADSKIAVQEAIVQTLNMVLPPKGIAQGTLPVVCHFENERDRAAFVAALEESKR